MRGVWISTVICQVGVNTVDINEFIDVRNTALIKFSIDFWVAPLESKRYTLCLWIAGGNRVRLTIYMYVVALVKKSRMSNNSRAGGQGGKPPPMWRVAAGRAAPIPHHNHEHALEVSFISVTPFDWHVRFSMLIWLGSRRKWTQLAVTL